MTNTKARTRIGFPAEHVTCLIQTGASVGELRSDRPGPRNVELPPGWTTDRGEEQGVPGRILDQHGRARIGVSWTYHTTVDSLVANRATSVEPHVTILDPGSHAREVAESGASLVLDEWATPGALLGPVGERIDTYTRLLYVAERSIARWKTEQPDTAERERQNREAYEQKLTAYRGLLRTLTDAVESGWAPNWAF
ncbi:hypothetical protein [Streptomyces sp. NRRL F-5135]|uniref:hypothetical protein n=1 Tax=Streptomyces sp. NRRL F-5135 TaxID=1463858 RepID=UPI0004C4A436|nr:hypothetical protein [Streptomyces sp. NRRL F-5135]